MNRILYIGVFLVSALVLALGLLFLCAAATVPGRAPLAVILLALGAIGAGWSARGYRRWRDLQPEQLAPRITLLAAENQAELSLAQIMSSLGAPADAALRAVESLAQRGECQREPREGKMIYVFPGLKERKAVRRCKYCGSEFPVKQPLRKCPNCGGQLELVII